MFRTLLKKHSVWIRETDLSAQFVKQFCSGVEHLNSKETRLFERNENTFTLAHYFISPCSCFDCIVNKSCEEKRKKTAADAWPRWTSFHFFAVAPIFARPKSEKCPERAEHQNTGQWLAGGVCPYCNHLTQFKTRKMNCFQGVFISNLNEPYFHTRTSQSRRHNLKH